MLDDASWDSIEWASDFIENRPDENTSPTDALRISKDPQYSSSSTKIQYVIQANNNGVPRYIFEKIDNQTLSAAIRFNYTISPNLSINYIGQPFVSVRSCKDFEYVINSIAVNLYKQFYR